MYFLVQTLTQIRYPRFHRRAVASSSQEHNMGQVISSAAMSLDGYIAKHDNTIGRLFDWLQPS